jgi:hypothetical protein
VSAPEAKPERSTPAFPESEKLALVSDERRAIAEFLEWSRDLGLVSVRGNVDDMILEFFGINWRLLERERQDMLAAIRGAQQ